MNPNQVRVLLECEFKFYAASVDDLNRPSLDRFLAAKGLVFAPQTMSDLSDNDLRRLNLALRTFLRT